VVVCRASDFQPLFAWSVGEHDSKNRRRVGAEREFAFTTIRGDRVGSSFVAQGCHPGQHGPKDRLWERNLDRFLRLRADRTNATPVGLPIQLKSSFPAQAQQIVDQTENTASVRVEHALKPLWK
jgi:hypothetical protein